MRQRPVQPRFRLKRETSVAMPGLVVLCLLMALPIYALSQLAGLVDWRILTAAPVAMSAGTYFAYRRDKWYAETGKWRIPEATLHLCELLGGWPGAFLAQRVLRHKISKTSYQVAFWGIILLHQFAALDSLLGWRFTRQAVQFIRAHAA
jgi:uncharacterized membrane protein YsdA (DUF1294 family)